MKSYIKKLLSGKGQAINKTKTNVPTTEIGKKTRDLNLAIQKSKAGKAKLDQTIFELKQNKDFTFKSNKGKSESNTESYKRITGENNKVIKNMLNKAVENKKDGGRMGYKVGGRIGLKHGSYETVPPSKGFSEYVTKEKQKKIDAANKKANEKDKPGGAGPMGRAAVKVGGRIGRKFGSPNPRKSNVQKIKETFGSKKQLSAKQMKIASLAGNKKKIDGPDFAKLRSKKV